ncbi:MAG: GNAT family N-acetyltransferase [Acidimicrobiia bacterium]
MGTRLADLEGLLDEASFSRDKVGASEADGLRGAVPENRATGVKPVIMIASADFDGLEGRALTTAYHEELRTRFPTDYDPARGLPATARDLKSPSGLFLVAHDEGVPVGCGGLKMLDAATGEIKHMFVKPSHRGRGIGAQILSALEDRAREYEFRRLVLDTSEYLTEAISLYRRSDYVESEAYNSNHYATHWFEKQLGAPQPHP